MTQFGRIRLGQTGHNTRLLPSLLLLLVVVWLSVFAVQVPATPADPSPTLPPPPPLPTGLADNISKIVNATLERSPELKQLVDNTPERTVVFKARPNATDLEKWGMELLHLPSMFCITGRIPDVILNAMKELGIVDYVSEAKKVRALDTPTLQTQTNPSNWGLDRIDQRAQQLDGRFVYPGSAGANVDIYIVDTGINLQHVDFGGRAIWGTTFLTNGNTQQTDDAGHGTMVASMAGGATYGVAKNATLIAVKVLDATGEGTSTNSIRALSWVWQRYQSDRTRRVVINMSLGGQVDRALDDAARTLVDEGITVVAAAGNGDENGNPLDACRGSPGSAKGVITVGATDSIDRVASFSNYGECLSLYAPGVDLTGASYRSTTGTVRMSGTSFAAPLVTGVVALMLSESPQLGASEINSRLLGAATRGVVRGVSNGSPNIMLSSAVDYSPATGAATRRLLPSLSMTSLLSLLAVSAASLPVLFTVLL